EEEDDQGRDTGGEVNDGAAGEVEGAQFEEPAVAHPDPVGDRIIDQGGPKQHEDAVGGELDALGQGARDQGHGDHGEHALVHGEDEFGNGARLGGDVLEQRVDRVAVLEGDQAVQHGLAEVAQETVAQV